MGTISVSLPSDGETIDAADYNTPINTIVTLVNGNIDSNNITAGGVVPNSLTSGAGTSWAWQSWTPTWTNITISSSTISAKYIQIGKTVFGKIAITLAGGEKPSGDVNFTLPVTSVALFSSADRRIIGSATIADVGSNLFTGVVLHNSTTKGTVRVGSTATYTNTANLSATIPMAYANGDEIYVEFTYEAA